MGDGENGEGDDGEVNKKDEEGDGGNNNGEEILSELEVLNEFYF